MTRFCWPALVAALTLAFASAAHASAVVGQLITPNNNCDGQSVTAFQTSVGSGASYAVPTAGVITAWSVRDGANTIDDLKLKVGRLVSGSDTYTIVGESAAGAQTPNTVSTYPAQIPVRAGDVIGFFADGGDCAVDTGSAGDQVVFAVGDQLVSSTGTYIAGPGLIPVAAKVEPDADGDGFGDETQDACPTDPSTHGPCPVATPPAAPPAPPRQAPAVIATIARVTKLSKRGTLSFTLADTENATGKATGTISLPKSAKVVRFRTARVRLTTGHSKKVTLHLAKSALKAVRKALKHHRLKVKLTVTLNNTVKRLHTTLKR